MLNHLRLVVLVSAVFVAVIPAAVVCCTGAQKQEAKTALSAAEEACAISLAAGVDLPAGSEDVCRIVEDAGPLIQKVLMLRSARRTGDAGADAADAKR